MSIRETIYDQIRAVAEEHKITLPSHDDGVYLLESGLDSLCFAILVSRLEDITGIDPFSAAQPATFPRTIGELVRLYDQINA